MSGLRPKELLATFGMERLTSLWVVYLFCLGSALVIGSTRLRALAAMATVLWTVGALVITLVARQSFLRFAAAAREIRLPDYTSVLKRSHAWLLGLTLALPILLFWSLIPEGRYWLCITLLVPLGVQSATFFGRSHSNEASRQSAAAVRAGNAPLRSPGRTIRMFIGRAYAPVFIRSRTFSVKASCVVLWSVSLWLILISTALVWMEIYVALTALGVWTWYLRSLGQFVRGRPGAYGELALLPGLGNVAAQKRGLYWAVLAPPLASLAGLIGVGLLAAYGVDHSAAHLIGRSVGWAIFLLYCAYGILQLVFSKRTVTTWEALALPSFVPLVIAPTLFRAPPIHAWFAPSPLERILLITLFLFAVVPVCLLWIYVYGLARSPHPFLEVNTPLEPDH
jgi:hypothetical protein